MLPLINVAGRAETDRQNSSLENVPVSLQVEY